MIPAEAVARLLRGRTAAYRKAMDPKVDTTKLDRARYLIDGGGAVAAFGADKVWRDGDRYVFSVGPRLLVALLGVLAWRLANPADTAWMPATVLT